MRGLYILTNQFLEDNQTIKFGMSLRLNERLFDYDAVFTNNRYLYCYIMELNKEHILFLEKIILEKTIKFRNFKLSSEYRIYTDINYYHNVVCGTLDKYEIKYEIQENPIFEKIKQNSETLDKTKYLQNIGENPFNISKRNMLQKMYLEELILELNQNNRVLCFAPTGFGKTRITYMLINVKKYKVIIFFTPRIILNKQSSSTKYTDLLDDDYEIIIFNRSQEIKINKNVIIYSCYQSAKLLYRQIKDHRINLIIFDEAHFIQSWDDNNYYMKSDNIGHRMFLTATPTDTMLSNTRLYGNNVNKVKIYELINCEILCNIETIIKQITDKKTEYHSLCYLICESMIKYNKKKGIIYVNTQENAVILYKLINTEKYRKYNVKSYIYISTKVDLKYVDDNKLEEFENNRNSSIIITCKKIDYGYDNLFIDLICFGDPKHGDIEIRQIMGRGLRNNKKVYPDKILHVLLPIYVDETNELKFQHVIAYLNYIIQECGQDIINGLTEGFQLSGNRKQLSDETYDGDNIPPSICKMLCTNSYHQYSNFMKFLRENKVYDEISYNRLREKHNWMVIFGKLRDKYQKFCFRDLHPLSRFYYWNYDECKIVIINIKRKKNNLIKNMTISKQIKKFNEIDNKIPNVNLRWYYPIKV